MAPPIVWLGVAWLLWNAATFAAVGRDKRRAQAGRRRTPERRLVLLGLLGGWLGGWLGFAIHRHKTRKDGFRLRFHAAGLLGLAVWATAGIFLLGGG